MNGSWLAGIDATVPGLLVASAVGLAGSLHCFGMCGPLACAALRGNVSTGRIATWQVSRIVGYGLLGALFGGAGGQVLKTFEAVSPAWLAWTVVAFLLASAFGILDRFKSAGPGVQIVRLTHKSTSTFASRARIALTGLVTGLIPCGLLPAVWAAALATGSVISGGLVAMAFGLGAVPALVFAQVGGGWLRERPRLAWIVQRAVPVVAAVLIAWRTLQTPEVPLCG